MKWVLLSAWVVVVVFWVVNIFYEGNKKRDAEWRARELISVGLARCLSSDRWSEVSRQKNVATNRRRC